MNDNRNHWQELNMEQRARLIRDMPLSENDDPSGEHFLSGLVNGLTVAAVVLLTVFVFYAIAKGWHL